MRVACGGMTMPSVHAAPHGHDSGRRSAMNMSCGVVSLVLCVIAALASPAAADESPGWHLPDWSHRAVVEVKGGGGEDVDVAGVRIRHAGLAREDGNDYRIFDADGEPVPYELVYHHGAQDSLISFRTPLPEGRFAVYFGNEQAEVDPRRAVVDHRRIASGPPEPGPQADGWIPRAGLVLTTLRRPKDDENPLTPEQMQALIDASPRPDGAAYRRNISDAYNPFGHSDYYISIYRGWLELDRDGRWGFATASNEASFSFLNGDELVHWPGRHTAERGRHGEQNAFHELDEGLHYVEYYHEEVLLYQLAFLGWKPPGAEHFDGIPEEKFPRQHDAMVAAYQRRAGGAIVPTIMPRAEMIDSLWPQDRSEGQYTRYRLKADAGEDVDEPDNWDITWRFGDGQQGAGAALEHVYLAVDDYTIELVAESPDGRIVERRWPLDVFPVEHVRRASFRAGRRGDYEPLLREAAIESLHTPLLIELALFWAEAERWERSIAAAEQALTRDDLPEVQHITTLRLAAGHAGSNEATWDGAVTGAAARRAAEYLEAAIAADEPGPRKLDSLARLIRVAGIELEDRDRAITLYEQAETVFENIGLTRQSQPFIQDAAIAMGDVELWHNRVNSAEKQYRFAEALNHPRVPPQVRAAQVGAKPEALAQHVQGGRLDDAEQVLEQWQRRFAADRTRGAVFYWRGRVARERERPGAALRPLRHAVSLGEGSEFEAHARWLLAEAHGGVGDEQARAQALRSLVRTGIAGQWRDRAKHALQEMESE